MSSAHSMDKELGVEANYIRCRLMPQLSSCMHDVFVLVLAIILLSIFLHFIMYYPQVVAFKMITAEAWPFMNHQFTNFVCGLRASSVQICERVRYIMMSISSFRHITKG